jgi:hypothetical protein
MAKTNYFDEMMIMMSSLYKTNMLTWIFIVFIAHRNNSWSEDMSPYSDNLT